MTLKKMNMTQNPFELIEERLNRMESLLYEIKNEPPSVTQELPDRCNLKDACIETGLSESKIYKAVMDRDIPFMKYGRRLVFSRKALREWVEERTIKPICPDTAMTERLEKTAKKRL
jgi:excisionase family DNA binding protein